jgi:hypothetical protein
MKYVQDIARPPARPPNQPREACPFLLVVLLEPVDDFRHVAAAPDLNVVKVRVLGKSECSASEPDDG